MKSFIVFAAFCAIASATFENSYVRLEEDTDGYYKLAYDTKLTSRDETRGHAGDVRGSYSFVDPEGIHHVVHYVAAENLGYTAQSADLPLPVPETVELIHARAEHLAIAERERALNPFVTEEPKIPVSHILSRLVVPEIARLPVPAVPAEDHEIEAERAHLLAAYREALDRLAEEYRKA